MIEEGQGRRGRWARADRGGRLAAAGASVRGGGGAGSRRPWSCICGQAYLVSGIDRHRVYWLPDAAQTDPLLVRECVSCGAELLAGHDAAPV